MLSISAISISLRVVSLSVPALRARGEAASLACEYDLAGGRLYSVNIKARLDTFATFDIHVVLVSIFLLVVSLSVPESISLHVVSLRVPVSISLRVVSLWVPVSISLRVVSLWVPVSISLRVVSLSVPALRARGEAASLACEYDLAGGRLYSVKWYRDNEEFYRFIVSISLRVVSLWVPVSISLRVVSLSVPALRARGEAASLACEYDLAGGRLYSVKWYRDNEEFYSIQVVPVLIFGVVSLWALVSISLRVVSLSVPALRARGEAASLACEYDLAGGRLYSVKWYRDNEEFYRYMPRLRPPQHAHALDGVTVDLHKSSARRVHLRDLTLKSRGLYRCEVSEEAPSFHSAEAEAFLEVYYFPREAPKVSGHERRYGNNEPLDVNCSSAEAFPAPDLQWLVNGQKVTNPSWLLPLATVPTPAGLLVSRLGLRAPARGRMRLRCVAAIGTQKRERSVVIETSRSCCNRPISILVVLVIVSICRNYIICMIS
ncbi:uncharacterized protein LOC105395638 [Plutella xylostella]|uniref:uncharacterized protein LOC105395638 n=1 Tax=Plutella xylostella TaxID=51655 RepID=UPI0020324710|nr:uncharacterized protein LOC105395638 [Plutella xylostella]